jgi:tetratricopeptide (TPR) repeat protein
LKFKFLLFLSLPFSLSLSLSVLLGGCALKQSISTPAASKEKLFYENGIHSISKKNYKESIAQFTALLQNYPATKWLPAIYYNLGVAYEGLSDYKTAAENYKHVIEFYDGLGTRDETEALFRYSICQEYIGDDDKMLFALLQLKDRGLFLSKEQGEVEVPARIAAAYARLGNYEEAKKYFSNSEDALKKLKRAVALAAVKNNSNRLADSAPALNNPTAETDLQAWLPKTLYSVGHIQFPSHDFSEPAFKAFLTNIEQSQERLLRAAELSQNPWSKKAAQELIDAYNQAWNWIDHLEVSKNADVLQEAKLRQDKQRLMSADFDVTIQHLKLLRIPTILGETENKFVSDIFKTAQGIERKLNIIVDESDVQDQETPEAQKRNSIKAQGRIRNKK